MTEVTKDINKVSGVLKISRDPTSVGFDISNVLLRENFLIDAEWAIGVVLFSGHDTKFW